MGVNILVVDDSDTVRSIIKKTLELAQVPITNLYMAANGQEALDVMRANWVDLVLTDINMPVMTGVQMLDTMAADEELKSVPVIVISTEGSDTRIDELKNKGVSAYVRKPFTPEQIREVLDSVLGGSYGE